MVGTKYRIRGAAALLLGLAGLAPAAAQELDMRALAQNVVETNPRIQAQRAAVNALEARLKSARAGYYPSLEASGLSERRQLTIHGAQGDQSFNIGQADVEARLPLFDGFRTPNTVKVAEAELKSGRAVLDATVQDVLLQLLTASADLQRDRLIRDYSQRQYDAVADQLKATARLLEFGEATRTDENQAKARLAVSQANIFASDEDLGTSAAVFEAVSGQPATIAPPLPELPPIPPNLEEARALAKDSPAVRSAQSTADAAAKAVSVARGALAPQVDLVGGYNYLTGGVANLFTGRLPNDRSALYGGVELRVPIFQQGKEYAEIERAKAVKNQRLQQVGATVRDTTQDVDTAWARWKSATATIAAARQAVAANEQAAEGVRREALGGGSRTVLDVLNAQNELLQARATLERAMRNEYVARASLLATLGRLSPQTLGPPVQ
jgi:outer membrane protein